MINGKDTCVNLSNANKTQWPVRFELTISHERNLLNITSVDYYPDK